MTGSSFEIGTKKGGASGGKGAYLTIRLRSRLLVPHLEAFAKEEGVTVEQSPDDVNEYWLPLKDSDMRVRLQASLWQAAYGEE